MVGPDQHLCMAPQGIEMGFDVEYSFHDKITERHPKFIQHDNPNLVLQPWWRCARAALQPRRRRGTAERRTGSFSASRGSDGRAQEHLTGRRFRLRLHSFQPYHSACEMDEAHEGGKDLFAAQGDPAEAFELLRKYSIW